MPHRMANHWYTGKHQEALFTQTATCRTSSGAGAGRGCVVCRLHDPTALVPPTEEGNKHIKTESS